MKRKFNIIYWLSVTAILILYYGNRSASFINAFYFISFLVPIALITSWYFNNFLIPDYLLKKRYGRFITLSIVTVIISLDLLMVIVFIAFIIIARFQPDNLGEIITQYYSFPILLYLTVIANGFFNLTREYLKIAEDMKELKDKKNKVENGQLRVRSNRQNITIHYSTILYIESMSDYVIIRTKDNKSIISRETISGLEQRLPTSFLRIHRSFIANLENMVSFSREQITISNKELPISRTFRKNVLDVLKES